MKKLFVVFMVLFLLVGCSSTDDKKSDKVDKPIEIKEQPKKEDPKEEPKEEIYKTGDTVVYSKGDKEIYSLKLIQLN